MKSRISVQINLRPLVAGLVAAALAAGCTSAGGAASVPSDSGKPAASSSAEDSGVAQPAGFYLRAWQTQALAPQYTFGMLPQATIANGVFINGMVAIPMIYPGPIYVALQSRAISVAGINAIVAEARADGLLAGSPEFGAALPGGVVAHIEIVVDGVTHELSGALPGGPAPAAATPGTAEAFAAFWDKITGLEAWLPAAFGQSSPYVPSSLAVMLTTPTEAPTGITAKVTPWPLNGTFATFGSPLGGAAMRCGTVSGSDLAVLLPALQSANALTRFTDTTGATMSAGARALVPGETGPCPS
jgi:hypothetical protein